MTFFESAVLAMFVKYVLPALLTAAMAYAVKWLQADAARRAAIGKTDGKNYVVEKVEHFAELALTPLFNDLLPRIKSAASDGKITSDEISDLAKAALSDLKALVNGKTTAQIIGMLDVDPQRVEDYLLAALKTKLADLMHTHSAWAKVATDVGAQVGAITAGNIKQ